MAKIYGLFGSMQGKVADVVMAVRNGEQIVRKYQPIVSNPKSQAQVESRAKMKLMSQLSAVMAPVIAIPRQGNVSSRNRFVKENYGLATYQDMQAEVTLSDIQLTKSSVAMTAVNATVAAETINVSVASNQNLDRVVYCLFFKQADNKLRFGGSKVVNAAGSNNNWPAEFYYSGEAAVIYAYGVRDNTQAARVTFGNYQTLTAETVAKIITTRTLLDSDITLTETRAALVAAAS